MAWKGMSAMAARLRVWATVGIAGVLIAGTNAVCTDAVATAVLGFDPMAARGSAPFENCDNMLALAEQLGIGSRDLNQIEVAGAQIADIRYDIRKA